MTYYLIKDKTDSWYIVTSAKAESCQWAETPLLAVSQGYNDSITITTPYTEYEVIATFPTRPAIAYLQTNYPELLI